MRFYAYLFLAVMAIPRLASALCDAPQPPRENLKHAQAVFVGTVDLVGPVETREIWQEHKAKVTRVVFDVERIWKGVTGKRFSMFVYSTDTRYAKGQKLLVYARKYGTQGLVGAFDCNDPVSYDAAAKKDLKELGPGNVPR